MRFFPLDPFVDRPAALMVMVPGHEAPTPIWDTYRTIFRRHVPVFDDFELLDRFEFNERTRKAYAVVATGEYALDANIIRKKVS
jgi:L-fucose mutarotase